MSPAREGSIAVRPSIPGAAGPREPEADRETPTGSRRRKSLSVRAFGAPGTVPVSRVDAIPSQVRAGGLLNPCVSMVYKEAVASFAEAWIETCRS